MWQMGGLGPMLGQAHHFRNYAPERIDYAYDRYTNEARRLYRVLDRRLGAARLLAGDEYSIADIAAWPWMGRPENQGVERDELGAEERRVGKEGGSKRQYRCARDH